jgi:L-cysteine:1D-myo-inositol 2-amino-2-deoxy-alpha-D-glucopyranoside ligase
MSKSQGNLVFVSRLRDDGHDPMALRLALLAHHYRSDWDWTDADLVSGEDRLLRWTYAATAERGPAAEPVIAEVRAALANDLDTPKALAAIDTWAEAVAGGEGDDAEAPARIATLSSSLLGVQLDR